MVDSDEEVDMGQENTSGENQQISGVMDTPTWHPLK
jgi:hypothetical protein